MWLFLLRKNHYCILSFTFETFTALHLGLLRLSLVLVLPCPCEKKREGNGHDLSLKCCFCSYLMLLRGNRKILSGNADLRGIFSPELKITGRSSGKVISKYRYSQSRLTWKLNWRALNGYTYSTVNMHGKDIRWCWLAYQTENVICR